MDAIFRALGDNNRRLLLDALMERDGRSLSELEPVLGHLSRFGVMKHLKILEAAGLITTHKEGRFKFHYLNPMPIQEIADRWISRFAGPWAQGMADLKQHLERKPGMSPSTTPDSPRHRFVTIIQTTPDALWSALTGAEWTRQYFFGLTVSSGWTPGSEITYLTGDGTVEIEGRVIEASPGHKLVYTFSGRCDDEGNVEPASRVTFEIEPMGAACRLTLVHDDFPFENKTYARVGNGWPMVLSGLKTLLETGKPLDVTRETEATTA